MCVDRLVGRLNLNLAMWTILGGIDRMSHLAIRVRPKSSLDPILEGI